MPNLIQTAVQDHAAESITQLLMIFAPLVGYLYLSLIWLPLTRLTKKLGVKILIMLVSSGLLFAALAAGQACLTGAASATKLGVALTTSVVEAAVAHPERVAILYQANTADLTVASTIEGLPEFKATLPMNLVFRLNQVISAQAQPRPDPLVKSQLEQQLLPVLEQAYVRFATRLWYGSLVALIGLFGLGVFCQGKLGTTLTLMVPWVGLLVGQLYAIKGDVQSRQTFACEPTAAVVAKAFTSPAEVTWLKLANGGWQLKATVPQAFLCPANTMTVVADLSPDLCRKLNAKAAVLGYAPLNAPKAPTPDRTGTSNSTPFCSSRTAL